MNFYQLLTILNARRNVAFLVFFFTVVVIVAVTLLLPKTYVASTSVVVNTTTSDSVTGAQMSAQETPGYMATQVDIISSPNVALKVIDKLSLYTNPVYIDSYYKATEGKIEIRDWLSTVLLNGLSVVPSKSSSVIFLYYQSTDPDYAATMANAFAEAYIETNLELKIEPSKRTATWFKKQVAEMRQNLVNAQQALSAYQKEKVIVSIDERADVESSRLAQLSQDLVAAQSQLFDLQSQWQSINQSDSRNSELLSGPMVRDMNTALARAEVQLADLKQRVSKNHPDYLSALSEVSVFRAKLETELSLAKNRLQNSMKIAAQRVAGLEEAIAKQKQTLLGINESRNRLDVLSRDVASAEQTLNAASQRLSQTILEGDLSESDVSVLTKATRPLNHSKPKFMLNVVLSVFLGLILAIGFALLAELLNRRVRTVDDLNNIGIPLLGEIPYSKQAKG
jgi:succinoglycan biosynthesis transport protein ExoP